MKSWIISIVLIFTVCVHAFAQTATTIADLKKRNEDAYALKNENAGEGLRQNWLVLKDAIPFKNDTVNAQIYSARGVLYSCLDEFDSSIFYHLKALNLREQIGIPDDIGKSFNNLGSLFYGNEQYESAIAYYKQSLSLKLRSTDLESIQKSYNNLGIAFQDNNDLDSAAYYFDKGLAIKAENSETELELKLNRGILCNDQKKWNKTIKVLSALYSKLEYWDMQALCLHNIGIAFEALELFDSAAYYFDRTDIILDSLDDLEQKMYLEKSKTILRFKINKDSLGLAGFNLYNSLSDSLNQQINESNIAESVEKYNNNKIIADLRLEEETTKRLKIEKDQNTMTIFALLAFIGLLFVLTIFVMRFYRQKRKLASLELTQKKNKIEQLMQGYELDLFEAQNFGQQEERKRIATDLHDRLGGLLAAVNLQIESLTYSQKNKVTSSELVKIKSMVSEGISEVRNISHNMQAEALKHHGLKGALEAICQSITNSKKINVDLYLDDLNHTTRTELEREVYKIIMELISNTLKHAQAKQITIQINEIDNELTLVYEDNGKGFSVNQTKNIGLGMESINTRVKKLKGNWNIDSHPNTGTTIIINIPKT